MYRRGYKTCQICGQSCPLEEITRAGYERGDGPAVGSGLVCPDCLAALPAVISVGPDVWLLVMRAP